MVLRGVPHPALPGQTMTVVSPENARCRALLGPEGFESPVTPVPEGIPVETALVAEASQHSALSTQHSTALDPPPVPRPEPPPSPVPVPTPQPIHDPLPVPNPAPEPSPDEPLLAQAASANQAPPAGAAADVPPNGHDAVNSDS